MLLEGNGEGAGPAKFERDANCAQETSGTNGDGNGKERNEVAMVAKY